MLKIESSTSLNEKTKSEIEKLYPEIFEHFKPEKFFKKFDYFSKCYLLFAYWDQRLVGFKFGYGNDPDLFYSWTGGVHPDFRNKGIAKMLMEKQHEWCKKENYKRIETRTRNKFPAMLHLNIAFGFQIVGSFTDTDQTPKIILRKELS